MKHLLTIGLTTAVALASPALAAESPSGPKFIMMGPSTCASYPKTGSTSSASKAVPLNWMLGYVSGWASVSDVRMLDLIDPDAVDAWVTAYCKDNPTHTLPTVARELERDLESKLPPRPAPPAEPMFVPPTPQADTPAKAKPPARKPAVRRKAPAKPAAKPAPKPATPTPPRAQ